MTGAYVEIKKASNGYIIAKRDGWNSEVFVCSCYSAIGGIVEKMLRNNNNNDKDKKTNDEQCEIVE